MTGNVRAPVLVIGMSRSGTTFAQRMLSFLPDVHFEIEPHMLWKTGSFSHLGDDRYELRADATTWIRERLLTAAGDRMLIDKSPANSLRPGLVHAVFPDARIVYVERDPVRCVYSNYKKSVARQSLHPRVVVRKYLVGNGRPEGDGDRGFEASVDATGGRSLFAQVRPAEVAAFAVYTSRMLWLRNVRKAVPFGPKLSNFWSIVRADGLLAYHARAVTAAARLRADFESLYGSRCSTFRLERLQDEPVEVERLFEACGADVTPGTVDRVRATFSPDVIAQSRAPSDADATIRTLLSRDDAPASRG